MRLVPREQDKLMLHYAGMLARDRKAQGSTTLKLWHT